MRGRVWALSLGLAGCGLVAPKLSDLKVETGTCGEWTASVEAWGVGQQARVEVDGELAGSWQVLGGQTLTASGVGAPGAALDVRAIAGSSMLRQTVTLPERQWAVSLAPASGAWTGSPVVLEGTLGSPCEVGGTRWRLVPPAPGVPVEGVLAEDGAVRADLGVLPEGRVEVGFEVEVAGRVDRLAPIVVQVAPPPEDRDGDGHLGDADCDETRRDVHADAAEKAAPNGIDDDCDGVVDEGTVAFDDDGDGFSEQAGDCDDADAARFPDAPERPDCRDQDCDGEVDEGLTRPEAEDGWEPNPDEAHAADLSTADLRSFRKELSLVTADVSDEAWFKFYSQDGDFDVWGITATLSQAPDGAAYELSLVDGAGRVVASRLLTAGGQEVATTGRMLHDDSGTYLLRVRPKVAPRAWCPVVVTLASR